MSIDIMKDTIHTAYSVLNLERRLVGVKLAMSKEEFDEYEAVELVRSLSYCVSVKCASEGHSLKFSRNVSGCTGSTRALGLGALDEEYLDGTEGVSLGLFPDKKSAKKVALQMPHCKNASYGVIVKPLEAFEKDPDLVLIIATPRELMRVVQGYTYTFGLQPAMSMTGNQAICIECSSQPLVTGRMNQSLLCSGTRYKAGWKDYEAAAGVPYQQFQGLVQGLLQTVNGVEMPERKLEIERRLGDSSGVHFDHSRTYYWEDKSAADNK